MNLSYKLTLADGFSLQITAGDAKAIPVVELLARAMMLKPGEAEYTLHVSTSNKEDLFSMHGKKVFCQILSPANQDDVVFKVMQVSLVIAHIVQKRGGILVHGGLAEFQGEGVILAAPSGTGKTTASDRLPASWRSLSDDLLLIVRGCDNRYYAHPWPTWSRFYFDGPGGCWKTDDSVPLKSMYFLFQSPEDALEELNANQAAAMLIESVEQANIIFNSNMSSVVIHENHLEQFAIVCAVTSCLPAYRLVLSLTGKFWVLLEKSLQQVTSQSAERSQRESFGQVKTAATGIVVSGSSMYPTLITPGYIDVQPYGNENPRRGDVVHFRSPAMGIMVVHRVIKVTPEGLITRGDHNAGNDPDCIPLSDVQGKVVAVKDAKGKRRVRGGRAGMMDYAYARLFRNFKMIAGRTYRLLFAANTPTGCLHRFTPQRANIKFVFFGNPVRGQLKIVVDDICVGNYNRGVWNIVYPWRLWVDQAKIAEAAKHVDLIKKKWLLVFMERRDG